MGLSCLLSVLMLCNAGLTRYDLRTSKAVWLNNFDVHLLNLKVESRQMLRTEVFVLDQAGCL